MTSVPRKLRRAGLARVERRRSFREDRQPSRPVASTIVAGTAVALQRWRSVNEEEQMTMRRRATLAFVLALAGCGSMESGADLKAPAPNPPTADRPVIEESDIYRRDGSYLYVQNAQTGLNILDVGDAAKPKLVSQSAATAGAAGELYLRQGQAIVLLKEVTSLCRKPASCPASSWLAGMEVAIIDSADRARPVVAERYCIPGNYVASRIVGDVLYLVTSDGVSSSRALSLDISNPRDARVVQVMEFPDAGKEILVTASAIFVAGTKAASGYYSGPQTSLQYISIAADGKLRARGSIQLDGAPQGRFHMDLAEEKAEFRIVTYDEYKRSSTLFLIDVSDPDALVLASKLGSIGSGERLYATRFDGDRAYVVTFRQTDPLWVISLAGRAPAIVGELHVPGWSDFLFPRGNRLIAVGRGDRGAYLGVSLFDVTNPAAPHSLSQITLGDPQATSEANVDHRAVTIVEQAGLPPLIVVPHTRAVYGSGCEIKDQLSLVEVKAKELVVRGSVGQKGTIQRALLVGSQLFSISEYEVLSVDIADRGQPKVSTAVTVGKNVTPSSTSYTAYCDSGHGWFGEADDSWGGRFLCSLPASGARGPGWPPALLVVGLAWLACRTLRRRARQQ
jgi:hypothetical protein